LNDSQDFKSLLVELEKVKEQRLCKDIKWYGSNAKAPKAS